MEQGLRVGPREDGEHSAWLVFGPPVLLLSLADRVCVSIAQFTRRTNLQCTTFFASLTCTCLLSVASEVIWTC
jgi:hypothetical protein